MRQQIKLVRPTAKGKLADQLTAIDQALAKMESAPRGVASANLGRLNDIYGSLVSLFQETDMTPTTQGKAGVVDSQTQFEKVMLEWKGWNEKDLMSLNKQLKSAGLKEIKSII